MRYNWRTISGPALLTAIAFIAAVVDRYYVTVPNLAALFVCIVACAAAFGGLGSGLLSAGLAVAFTALYLQDHGRTPGMNPANLVRLTMLAIAAIGAAAVTGMMRKKMRNALIWERQQHITSERLSSALDRIDIGVVLLDADTRAEFINRAFRRYFMLPDDKADSKPPFIALMYHGRDAGAYELAEDELNHFIAERTKMMREGDSTPININLANGQVLRFSCTALPDGGRMLSYTPVTDIIRHSDDLANKEYYLALREGADVLSGWTMRAAE